MFPQNEFQLKPDAVIMKRVQGFDRKANYIHDSRITAGGAAETFNAFRRRKVDSNSHALSSKQTPSSPNSICTNSNSLSPLKFITLANLINCGNRSLMHSVNHAGGDGGGGGFTGTAMSSCRTSSFIVENKKRSSSVSDNRR